MIGRTLGNYRIIEQIGLGGMATVFKGYDPDTDRYVAVKILPQQFSADPQFRERFQREAKAIAKLEHLHILPIFAYGEDDGISYMAMRYLQAGTLTDRISKGALPFAEAGRILSQLASALDHAHTYGILHRDMKPSNVLLDDEGNAYLMDFGIAKIVEATVDLTGDRLLGTPAYMSPEQCQGINIGPATDIYSLGIILNEMVTGRRPFHAETPIAVILQQLNDPLPPPHELRSDLPPQAENVIFKALAKKPESRYQTATELANAFNKAIAQATTDVGTTRPVYTTPEPEPEPETIPHTQAASVEKRQFPGWAWGLTGVIAAAMLITVGFFLANRSSSGEQKQLADIPETVEVETAVSPAATTTQSNNPQPAALPPPECQPGETLLFFDDFEDGILNGWDLSDASSNPTTTSWEIATDGNNHVLAGKGHNWAVPQNIFGQNVALHLRILPNLTGDFHVNVRMEDGGRYYIGPGFIFRDPIDFNLANWHYQPDDEWHEMMVQLKDNRIQLFWDGVLVADEEDLEPVLGGGIGLENGSGTVWYDDILLCGLSDPVVEEKPTPDSQPLTTDESINAFDYVTPIAAENNLKVLGNPSWHPDGKQISFTAIEQGGNPNDDSQIYVVNFDGSSLSQLPKVGNDVNAVWSPDGEWLAFHSSCDLFKMRSTGTDVSWIGGMAPEWCVEALAWAPDSQWLVYTALPREAQVTDGTRRIMLTSAAGEEEQLIDTMAKNDDCWQHVEIAFSPDGSQVAYVDGDCQPQLLDLSTLQSKPIAEFPNKWTSEWYPQWSEQAVEVTAVSTPTLNFVASNQFAGSPNCGKPNIGDLNGDETLDIFIGKGNGMEAWLNDGSGHFIEGPQVEDTAAGDGSCSNFVALGDLDSDGDLDAVVGIFEGDHGGDNVVWMNDGNGRFTNSEQRLSGSHSWAIALGDFDSDGDLDIFDVSGGPSLIWENDGNGRFTHSGQLLGKNDSWYVDLGDLDGDDDLDAFVANGNGTGAQANTI